MIQNLGIREATPDDIPEILRQRRAMYLDMDYADSPELAQMISACEQYLSKAMREDSFLSWLALAGGRVAGGGAVLISPGRVIPTISCAAARRFSTSTSILSFDVKASRDNSCKP